jgi:hypothetical protein
VRYALALAAGLGLGGCPLPTTNPPSPRPQPAPIPTASPDAAPVAPVLPPLPTDAAQVVARVAAACKAKDFAGLRSLMSRTVTVAIDTKAVAADAAITQWRADSTPLVAIANAIDRGCELVAGKTDELVCPADAVSTTPDWDGVFLVVMHKDKHGAWLLSQALYTD